LLLRVLGPLEIAGEAGPVALAAPKLRALLAALTIRRGGMWTTDELMDALWGEQPPPSAPKLLQVYVSQLRRALPDGARIVTRGRAYGLELQPDQLDAAVFERLVAEGREASRASNPALTASILRRALGLWRGTAYADVRYEPWALEVAERLDRLRETALEDRATADLRLGRHAEVVGELRGLVAADPTRERLAELAMLAAHVAEGPAEALELFATVERALRAEFDAEPGPELRELRDRIIRRDPTLADTRATTDERPGALPLAPNALIGREREVADLRMMLDQGVRLLSLTGAGGSGKSRLALELAGQLAPAFANGAVLVELASLDDPELVPATIARTCGIDPGADAMAALTAGLAARETLLVLDNVEHLRRAAVGIARVLATAPRLVVVATTRVVLHVSGEHVYPVGPLAEAHAVDLFAERVRARDPGFVLDPTTRPTVESIVRRVDGLPLAIELAAARAPMLGLRTLDERLASRLTVLVGGPRDLPARQQTLRETLAWSVQLLEPEHADVLAALAVFPGGCSMDAAAAVAGADDEALGTLVDHHLIQAGDVDGERRFRLLETVREYAYERLGDRRPAVESALASWMVGIVEAIDLPGLGPPRASVFRRLDVELDNLRDALRFAARDAFPDRELTIAAGVWHYWYHRGHLAEGHALYEGILERRGIVPTRWGIRVARAAASFAWALGDRARTHLLGEQVLAAASALGDPVEQSAAHNLLGVLLTGEEDLEGATTHLLEAIRVAVAGGDVEAASMPRLNLGVAYMNSGKLDDARVEFQTLLEFRRLEGVTEGVGLAHTNLGEVELAADDLAAAEGHFVAAAEVFRGIGFKVRLAGSLQGIAAVEVRTGRAEAAARRLGRAAVLLSETGWSQDGVALGEPTIAAAREALGDEMFERLFAEGAREESAR
jgi:predicted ATPase/DNA-binding SARP family transcriptional activator